jgi:NAD-dependent SIR2 family protein deacetylase
MGCIRGPQLEVIELHGNIGCVICLGCGATQARNRSATLAEQNPAFFDEVAQTAPDGDADLEHCELDEFSVPQCGHCGGMLKPDVVFFGEGIPRTRVDAARAALEEADAMLVVGSSLMVYSVTGFASTRMRWASPLLRSTAAARAPITCSR